MHLVLAIGCVKVKQHKTAGGLIFEEEETIARDTLWHARRYAERLRACADRHGVLDAGHFRRDV